MIAGVKDASPYPPDGGTSGTGGQGGGETSTTGGGGGATICAPGMKIDCYSGPDGTKGIGICQAGKQTCRMDGSGYDACVGEVKPKAESCAAKEDENCDGHDCVQWAELFGDGADQKALALAVDAAGNSYVVGTFAGAITINGQKIASAGSSDAFLFKFDPMGKAIWGKAFGDVDAQEGQSVALDSIGNVAIAGASATSLSLGGPMVPAGLFVAKLTSDGQFLWSKGLGAVGCGGTSDSSINAMTVTSANDFVLAGQYCGIIDFGDGPIPSQMGSMDGFVALLRGGDGSAKKSDGAWSTVFGDEKSQRAVSVAMVGGFGEIIVVGDFAGSMNMGSASTSLSSQGGSDIFYAKLSSTDGASFDAQRFGDSTDQYASAVAADIAGNFVIAGQFGGTLDFATGTLSTLPSISRAFVAQFNALETYQWGKALGSNDGFFGSVTDIALDSAGNIILGGIYSGSIDFGDGLLTAPNLHIDIFLAKITSSGQHLWSKSFDSSSDFSFARMGLSPSSEPILAGAVSGPIDFGTSSLTTSGSFDGFIAKFSQ